MRFVQRKERRKVYVTQEGDLYLLSPLPETKGTYRPVQQFDREELDKFVSDNGVEIVWQT